MRICRNLLKGLNCPLGGCAPPFSLAKPSATATRYDSRDPFTRTARTRSWPLLLTGRQAFDTSIILCHPYLNRSTELQGDQLILDPLRGWNLLMAPDNVPVRSPFRENHADDSGRRQRLEKLVSLG